MFLSELIRFVGKSLEIQDNIIVTVDIRQVVARVVCSSGVWAVDVLICSNSSLKRLLYLA